MDYEKANELLSGRNKSQKKVACNTYLGRRDDHIALKVWNTDVIRYYPNGDIVLNSGGYRTILTKDRINAFQDRVVIFQKKREWYVAKPGQWDTGVGFDDNVRIDKDGNIQGAKSAKEIKEDAKLNKCILAYAKGFIEALVAGKIEQPGPGDCFMCNLREVATGKPIGDVQNDRDHLLSHIAEKYYVPSLLVNAVKGCSVAVQDMVSIRLYRKEKSYLEVTFTIQQAQKAIAKYLRSRLGIA